MVYCSSIIGPAHFHDVTDDKVKSNFVKILQDHARIIQATLPHDLG